MKNLIYFFLFLSSGIIHAQSKITGTVTDHSLGDALIGATVELYNDTGFNIVAVTDLEGQYLLSQIDTGQYFLMINYVGYISQQVELTIATDTTINLSFQMNMGVQLDELVVTGYRVSANRVSCSQSAYTVSGSKANRSRSKKRTSPSRLSDSHRENYVAWSANKFRSPVAAPYSTFSIDVDHAAYTRGRRALKEDRLPPAESVRLEEYINYFDYASADFSQGEPVVIETEYTQSSRSKDVNILRVKIEGKAIASTANERNNLVFLLDVSGSMAGEDRLDRIVNGIKDMISSLDSQDMISIVVYAGQAVERLPATKVADKTKILDVLSSLQAAGSTAGEDGLKMAYVAARKSFIPEGNNRIILATDGDFNVGKKTETEVKELISNEAKGGIYFTVLGVGTDNFQDRMLEAIARSGQGSYYYLDSDKEASRVLTYGLTSHLKTIARNVKLQIEFNPDRVQAYRLLGYESRLLDAEDFNDDKIDAAELGVGQQVTALYEIVPIGADNHYSTSVDAPRYARTKKTRRAVSGELCSIKLRYKEPKGIRSDKIETYVSYQPAPSMSEDMRLSVAVATWAMCLRQDDQSEGYSLGDAIALARELSETSDDDKLRELVDLMEISSDLLAQVD